MVKRRPVPEQLREAATIPGVPAMARVRGDLHASSLVRERWEAGGKDSEAEFARGRSHGLEPNFLAISGGGQEGAFGAGLLNGWSEAGDRPPFIMVTGISTGALSAPLAFLGPAHDEALEEIYSKYGTKDLLRKRTIVQAVLGSSMYATDGLAQVIAQYIDDDLVQAMADQQRLGRRCWVCTSDLDAMIPVYWSLGHIAAEPGRHAKHLIRKILLASAAIPGAFPPVHLEVEADGRRFDELHVDGGATSQVFVYPLGVDMKEYLRLAGFPKQRVRLYVIRNAKLTPTPEGVQPRMLSIIARAVSSMVRTQGLGDLYRIYLGALRDGIEFHFACIPDAFKRRSTEPFDVGYMRELYQCGYSMAKGGYPWMTSPPGYESIDVEVHRKQEAPPAVRD